MWDARVISFGFSGYFSRISSFIVTDLKSFLSRWEVSCVFVCRERGGIVRNNFYVVYRMFISF